MVIGKVAPQAAKVCGSTGSDTDQTQLVHAHCHSRSTPVGNTLGVVRYGPTPRLTDLYLGVGGKRVAS